MSPVVPLAEAVEHVLAALAPLAPVRTDLREALGSVAAEDVVAGLDLPPFDNSALDGFAVVHTDVADAGPDAPAVLDVTGTRLAGDGRAARVVPGTCVRIMTGAPLPAGADAVVMVEDAEAVPGPIDRVALRRAAARGAGVRHAGSDVAAGSTVVRAGTSLRAAHLGVLASLGLAQVAVTRRPRVAVLSTGDELMPAGAVLAPGQIYDSNRSLLVGLATAAGFDAVDLGSVADDRDAVTDALRRATASCDAVLTSGGVSMGEVDLVKAVLAELGEMRWMQLAIKPAKPFAFGLLDGTPVFGLPGNPVSALVSFHLLALPGLRRLAGEPEPRPARVPAVAAAHFDRKADGKDHFVRVTVGHTADGRRTVQPVTAQGSHQLAATAGARALAVIPDGPGCAPGDLVEVIELL